MKRIANIRITVDELPEDAYLATVNEIEHETVSVDSDPIYGNTLIQIRQRIGKRLEKLIVEEES